MKTVCQYYVTQTCIVILGICSDSGMGSHSYSGQSDGSSGFHSGHFVHMRGLPFRATEGDIAKVRTQTHTYTQTVIVKMTVGKMKA